jgi:hypothetical protein
VAPLQLIVSGKIVRSHGNRTAVEMVQHEFRTLAVASDHRPAAANRTNLPPGLLTGTNRFQAAGVR